jgi:hypothetical protein
MSWIKGQKITEEHRRKLSLAKIGKKPKNFEEMRKLGSLACTGRTGEKSWNWKGDNISYIGIHAWIYRVCGHPTTCEICGKTNLIKHHIHWANKTGKYLRDENDWFPLCVSCHKKYDLERKTHASRE